jgi:DNA-binding transcriptional MerR regulator
MAEAGPAHLSIGEVLGLLLEEFPDVTISKIRFLESQGLIEPERTPSGYRKFFDDDVELLRLILREQREKFLPLRVIKDRLDSGEIEPPDPTPSKGAAEPERPSPAVVAKHPSTGRIVRPAEPAAAAAAHEVRQR